MSFYITLPSNNYEFFPENKVPHFITRLSTPIELQFEWDVDVVEFLYPRTLNNINARNNLIRFDLNDGEAIGLRLPPGFYETVPEILNAISLEEHIGKIYFKFNPANKKVCIRVQNCACVILYDGLATSLGFELMEIDPLNDNIEMAVKVSTWQIPGFTVGF